MGTYDLGHDTLATVEHTYDLGPEGDSDETYIHGSACAMQATAAPLPKCTLELWEHTYSTLAVFVF